MTSVIWSQCPTAFWIGRGIISVSSLNVHGDNDVRQTEIHTAEPRVPEPNVFEVKIATEKLKGHKLPGIGQIQTESIKAGGKQICSEIHKLNNFI